MHFLQKYLGMFNAKGLLNILVYIWELVINIQATLFWEVGLAINIHSKQAILFWQKQKPTEKSTKKNFIRKKKVREKSRECHNYQPQPFPDPKRKRKPTNLNKHKPNKRTKSTKISSLFPKRGNRNTKRTEKHTNKMIHGKTYNKSPRRINHKATKSKTNTGTTALERSVEQTTGWGWWGRGGGVVKALLQLANFTLVPMLLLIQKYIKIRFA